MQKPGPICTLTVTETLMAFYGTKLQRGRNGTPFELSKTVDLRPLTIGVKFSILVRRSSGTMASSEGNSAIVPAASVSPFAKNLTLVETLRVLEVARGLRREREVAEVALARDEIRTLMRTRLMEAAVVTGDKITEADVDAAIEQYFATQHTYNDPPFSFRVLMAHLWVSRFSIVVVAGLILAGWLVVSWIF